MEYAIKGLFTVESDRLSTSVHQAFYLRVWNAGPMSLTLLLPGLDKVGP